MKIDRQWLQAVKLGRGITEVLPALVDKIPGFYDRFIIRTQSQQSIDLFNQTVGLGRDPVECVAQLVDLRDLCRDLSGDDGVERC